MGRGRGSGASGSVGIGAVTGLTAPRSGGVGWIHPGLEGNGSGELDDVELVFDRCAVYFQRGRRFRCYRRRYGRSRRSPCDSWREMVSIVDMINTAIEDVDNNTPRARVLAKSPTPIRVRNDR